MFLAKKHACPFAVLAAAVINYSSHENLKIHENEFDGYNSRTQIEKVKKFYA